MSIIIVLATVRKKSDAEKFAKLLVGKNLQHALT